MAGLKGILLFNDRTAGTTITLTGQSSIDVVSGPTGFIYNKSGLLNLTGQGSIGCIGAVINQLDQSGQGQINAPDFSHTPQIPKVRLVE